MDGELTEERRLVIRQHLDDCPPCGGAFDFEGELRMVISRRCRDTVPQELRDRIAQALSEFGDLDGTAEHDTPA
jgi:mycothiol system anti-sigma-R factor